MTDNNRLQSSISEEVAKLLNEQIRVEALSSAKYLALASWCDDKGLENSAEFFYEQSDEERSHMLKLFRYLQDVGAKAYSPEITAINHNFTSLREIFESALEQEVTVSKAIDKIVAACRNAQDFSTENFMQWFISEQIEEEQIARRMVELFDIIGESGQGLYMIDLEVSKIRANIAKEATV